MDETNFIYYILCLFESLKSAVHSIVLHLMWNNTPNRIIIFKHFAWRGQCIRSPTPAACMYVLLEQSMEKASCEYAISMGNRATMVMISFCQAQEWKLSN